MNSKSVSIKRLKYCIWGEFKSKYPGIYIYIYIFVGYHPPFRHNEPVPSAMYITVVYKTSESDEVSLSLNKSSLEGE